LKPHASSANIISTEKKEKPASEVAYCRFFASSVFLVMVTSFLPHMISLIGFPLAIFDLTNNTNLASIS
jgi:hypothetical protein